MSLTLCSNSFILILRSIEQYFPFNLGGKHLPQHKLFPQIPVNRTKKNNMIDFSRISLQFIFNIPFLIKKIITSCQNIEIAILKFIVDQFNDKYFSSSTFTDCFRHQDILLCMLHHIQTGVVFWPEEGGNQTSSSLPSPLGCTLLFCNDNTRRLQHYLANQFISGSHWENTTFFFLRPELRDRVSQSRLMIFLLFGGGVGTGEREGEGSSSILVIGKRPLVERRRRKKARINLIRNTMISKWSRQSTATFPSTETLCLTSVYGLPSANIPRLNN